jgi:hypothetical protein
MTSINWAGSLIARRLHATITSPFSTGSRRPLRTVVLNRRRVEAEDSTDSVFVYVP